MVLSDADITALNAIETRCITKYNDGIEQYKHIYNVEKSSEIMILYNKLITEFDNSEREICELINKTDIPYKSIIIDAIGVCIECVKCALYEFELSVKLNNYDNIETIICLCNKEVNIFKQTIKVLSTTSTIINHCQKTGNADNSTLAPGFV